jgi:hypothetical protein
MTQQYDIFRLDEDGKELWIEPAKTLDEAKARVHELGVREPGDFFIFNHTSAERIELRIEHPKDF